MIKFRVQPLAVPLLPLRKSYRNSRDWKWHCYSNNLNLFKILNNLQTSGHRVLIISKLLLHPSQLIMAQWFWESGLQLLTPELQVKYSQLGYGKWVCTLSVTEGLRDDGLLGDTKGQRYHLGGSCSCPGERWWGPDLKLWRMGRRWAGTVRMCLPKIKSLKETWGLLVGQMKEKGYRKKTWCGWETKEFWPG